MSLDQDGRILTLDVIRGVAVLGILLMNIVAFAMPQAAYYNPRAYGGTQGADLAVYLVNFVLFDGKMRGLFSFLFGASLLLVTQRAESSGRSPAAVHYVRMAWLLVFGLAHLWLIWNGDILAHYALVGMIAFAFRDLSAQRLVVLGGMLVLLAILLFATFPLMVAQGETASLVNALGVPPSSEIGRELAQYRGSYGAILAHRLAQDGSAPLRLLSLYGCETLAYMLFGMAALRSGLLAGSWSRRRIRRVLLVSWGLALPASMALTAYMAEAEFSLFSVSLAAITAAALLRPPMILGWICLILLLLTPCGALTRRLAAAGRMAFTNYIATSLICTTLFYGYGLGWFGHLSRWQLYPVVLAIWSAILWWSPAWMSRYGFGPLEWLWRSLARRQIQRIA